MKSAIALLLGLVLPAIAADPSAPAGGDAVAESRRLSEAAFEEYHRANDLEEGFATSYDGAIELAERAITLDPRNADAHYALFLNLGRKSERTGIVAQARNMRRLRNVLETTLELDPRHAHAWEAMGEMHMRLPRLMGGS
ncbi:MAG: hypothetical protein ACREQY_04655, partial [Candidatus Binatia bacterium]